MAKNNVQTAEALEDTTLKEHIPTVVKGASIHFFGAIAGKFLAFVFVFLVARILGARDLGLYFLGISIIELATIPALLGLDAGILRFVSMFKGEGNEKYVRATVVSALAIALLVSVSISATLFFFARNISIYIFHKPAMSSVIKLLSVSIPFLALANVFWASTQALQLMQYKVYGKNLARWLVRILLLPIVIIFGWKLSGVVLITVIASLFVAVLGFYHTNKFIPLFKVSTANSKGFKDLLSFSIPQTFSQTFIVALLYADILLLGVYLPASQVGVYSVAARIAVLSSLVLEAFNAIFAPMISDLYNRGENEVLASLFRLITKWILSLTLPLILLLIILAKPILGLFGNDFVLGSTVLIILSIGQIIKSGTGPVGFLIIMSGRPALEMITNMIALTLNVAMNILLIPTLGIVGAAIATAVSISSVNLIRLAIVKFTLNMQPYNISYLKPLLAAAISSLLVVFGLVMMTAEPSKVVLLASGAAFVVVYVGLLVLLGGDADDAYILKVVKEKLSRMAFLKIQNETTSK